MAVTPKGPGLNNNRRRMCSQFALFDLSSFQFDHSTSSSVRQKQSFDRH